MLTLNPSQTQGLSMAQPTVQPRNPLLQVLSSALEVGTQGTQLVNSLLMNLMRASQQAPSAAAPSTTSAPQPFNSGLGAIGGLLQSFAGLLQSMAPLLQSLSGTNGFGTNAPAQKIGVQLAPVGLSTPLASAGAAGGVAAPGGLSNAGAQIGAAVGGALGGPAGAQIGAVIGSVAGGVAGTALSAATGNPAAAGIAGATGLPNTGSPFTTIGIGSGAMTADAARAWALANGGVTQTAAETRQGMNLYSIFNSGNRMF